MHRIDVLRLKKCLCIKSVKNHWADDQAKSERIYDAFTIPRSVLHNLHVASMLNAQIYSVFLVLGYKILASKILSPAFIDSFDPKRQHNVEAKRLTYIMEYNSSLKIMSHCYLTLQTCAEHFKCMIRCFFVLIIDQRFDDGCNCIRSTSNARSQRFELIFSSYHYYYCYYYYHHSPVFFRISLSLMHLTVFDWCDWILIVCRLYIYDVRTAKKVMIKQQKQHKAESCASWIFFSTVARRDE